MAPIGQRRMNFSVGASDCASILEKKSINGQDEFISKGIERILETRKRVKDMCSSSKGEYTVIGVDKFSDEDWIHGTYKTKKDALDEARKMTEESAHYASDATIATVYYAYDPCGIFLGGDDVACNYDLLEKRDSKKQEDPEYV